MGKILSKAKWIKKHEKNKESNSLQEYAQMPNLFQKNVCCYL